MLGAIKLDLISGGGVIASLPILVVLEDPPRSGCEPLLALVDVDSVVERVLDVLLPGCYERMALDLPEFYVVVSDGHELPVILPGDSVHLGGINLGTRDKPGTLPIINLNLIIKLISEYQIKAEDK